MTNIPVSNIQTVFVCSVIAMYIHLNCILDRDRDRLNVGHRLLVHVPGGIRRDNVARHIPKIKKVDKTMTI